MASSIRSVFRSLCKPQELQVQQIREKLTGQQGFADWRMLKDFKKRKCVQEYGPERMRLNSLRKNKILPPELKALADEEVAALPRQSSVLQVVYRCAFTSRPRGNVKDFRVSRLVFRHLADYNKLAGVQRAMW